MVLDVGSFWSDGTQEYTTQTLRPKVRVPKMVIFTHSATDSASLAEPRSLKTLNTGTTVNRIAGNYIDWLSSPQPVIVGHIVVPGADLFIRKTAHAQSFLKMSMLLALRRSRHSASCIQLRSIGVVSA